MEYTVDISRKLAGIIMQLYNSELYRDKISQEIKEDMEKIYRRSLEDIDKLYKAMAEWKDDGKIYPCGYEVIFDTEKQDFHNGAWMPSVGFRRKYKASKERLQNKNVKIMFE